MEKVIYDENYGLWYELQGDYYIPCWKLPDEEQVKAQNQMEWVNWMNNIRQRVNTIIKQELIYA